jgi:hypothetical protein
MAVSGSQSISGSAGALRRMSAIYPRPGHRGSYLVCEMARWLMPRSTVAPLSVLACCLGPSRASTGVARLDMEPSCGRLSAGALYLSSPDLKSAP